MRQELTGIFHTCARCRHNPQPQIWGSSANHPKSLWQRNRVIQTIPELLDTYGLPMSRRLECDTVSPGHQSTGRNAVPRSQLNTCHRFCCCARTVQLPSSIAAPPFADCFDCPANCRPLLSICYTDAFVKAIDAESSFLSEAAPTSPLFLHGLFGVDSSQFAPLTMGRECFTRHTWMMAGASHAVAWGVFRTRSSWCQPLRQRFNDGVQQQTAAAGYRYGGRRTARQQSVRDQGRHRILPYMIAGPRRQRVQRKTRR